jgi:hypothetical protein
MSQSSPRSNRMLPYNITLRLNDIHDLFALPRYNAFQENFLPLSGIDQLAHQLKLAQIRHNGLHVTFMLPESAKQDRIQESEVQTAIQRYCNARLNHLMIELKARQLNIIRSLEVGVIILGISLALAAAISHSETIIEWLRTLLSNSIGIFGSVALWSPADAFLFGIRPLYHELHVYRAIGVMRFDIQYEEPNSTSILSDQPIFARGLQ